MSDRSAKGAMRTFDPALITQAQSYSQKSQSAVAHSFLKALVGGVDESTLRALVDAAFWADTSTAWRELRDLYLASGRDVETMRLASTAGLGSQELKELLAAENFSLTTLRVMADLSERTDAAALPVKDAPNAKRHGLNRATLRQRMR